MLHNMNIIKTLKRLFCRKKAIICCLGDLTDDDTNIYTAINIYNPIEVNVLICQDSIDKVLNINEIRDVINNKIRSSIKINFITPCCENLSDYKYLVVGFEAYAKMYHLPYISLTDFVHKYYPCSICKEYNLKCRAGEDIPNIPCSI